MIVLVGGEKGGVGKSVLAVHLAEVRTGPIPKQDVALVDADRQGSASMWAAARIEAGIELAARKGHGVLTVTQAQGPEVAEVARGLAQDHADVVLDVPGRNSVELRAAMLVADVLVLPVRIGTFDAWTLEGMEGHVVAANAARAEAGGGPLRALMVLNAVNLRATRRIAEARDFLGGFAPVMELAAVVVGERAAFDEAIGKGRTARELVRKVPGPEWAASQDIAKLSVEVFGNGDA